MTTSNQQTLGYSIYSNPIRIWHDSNDVSISLYGYGDISGATTDISHTTFTAGLPGYTQDISGNVDPLVQADVQASYILYTAGTPGSSNNGHPFTQISTNTSIDVSFSSLNIGSGTYIRVFGIAGGGGGGGGGRSDNAYSSGGGGGGGYGGVILSEAFEVKDTNDIFTFQVGGGGSGGGHSSSGGNHNGSNGNTGGTTSFSYTDGLGNTITATSTGGHHGDGGKSAAASHAGSRGDGGSMGSTTTSNSLIVKEMNGGAGTGGGKHRSGGGGANISSVTVPESSISIPLADWLISSINNSESNSYAFGAGGSGGDGSHPSTATGGAHSGNSGKDGLLVIIITTGNVALS